MAFRRQVLAGLGIAVVGVVGGCSGVAGTSGTVARKQITVEVPQSAGDPVDVRLAHVSFETERRLVTGSYADVAASVVDGPELSVSDDVHERLSDRFSSVTYSTNVVPEDGATPANGLVSRAAFNRLSIGGSATVERDGGDGDTGRLRVLEATPPEREPVEVTVDSFDFETRVDDR